MDATYVIYLVNVQLSSIALLLHLLGVYVLKVSKKWNNQIMILMNLSVAEMVMLVNHVIADCMRLSNYSEDKLRKELLGDYNKIELFLSYLSYNELTLSLILLTADRLICVLSPLNYNIILEEKSIFQKMIIVSWLKSITIASVTLIPYVEYPARMFVYVELNFTIVLFLITYVLIWHMIKSSRRSLHNNASTTHRNERIRFKKHHLVPALIILTYIIFYFIPITLMVCYIPTLSTVEKRMRVKLIMVVTTLGYISDPFIYIFLTKENRRVIVKKILCC